MLKLNHINYRKTARECDEIVIPILKNNKVIILTINLAFDINIYKMSLQQFNLINTEGICTIRNIKINGGNFYSAYIIDRSIKYAHIPHKRIIENSERIEQKLAKESYYAIPSNIILIIADYMYVKSAKKTHKDTLLLEKLYKSLKNIEIKKFA
ncbi:MAG: hypothetical protein ACOCQR_03665 [bacterium]